MKQKPSSRRRRNSTKSILRLPDLEHAKDVVLNSLNSTDAKRGYRHAIDEHKLPPLVRQNPVNALWESGPVEWSKARCRARIRGEDRQIG